VGEYLGLVEFVHAFDVTVVVVWHFTGAREAPRDCRKRKHIR